MYICLHVLYLRASGISAVWIGQRQHQVPVPRSRQLLSPLYPTPLSLIELVNGVGGSTLVVSSYQHERVVTVWYDGSLGREINH